MIGERLKQLRKEKGITQQELAEILGVRKAAVSLYETGQNDPADRIKILIAKYFDISLDYLLGVVDKPVKYYNENNFVELPENISDKEKWLIKKFMEFIDYITNKV